MGSKTFVVDGVEYEVVRWSADKGFKTLMRLGRVLGEPLAALMEAKKADEAGEESIVEKALGQAVAKIFTAMEPDDALAFCKDLLSATKCQNVEIARDFSNRFSGKMVHMMKVVVETLKYQYEDFSDALASVMPAVAAMGRSK